MQNNSFKCDILSGNDKYFLLKVSLIYSFSSILSEKEKSKKHDDGEEHKELQVDWIQFGHVQLKEETAKFGRQCGQPSLVKQHILRS